MTKASHWPGKRVLVTGGAGFIGSALVLRLVALGARVTVIDKMTYAANPASLATAEAAEGFELIRADIVNAGVVERALKDSQPDIVFHLAAESHVDRSIIASDAFLQTNIIGTHRLLEATRAYMDEEGVCEGFRLIHISTDEVFGSLGPVGQFREDTRYDPSSPYSASKAASDHLVRAWTRTFGIPAIVSNCSNNYGPRQFPEKLIPRMIIAGLEGKPLPVFGQGINRRDWLHVEDHVDALLLMAERGAIGMTYVVGGHGERRNLDVVEGICERLDEVRPAHGPHRRLIEFVSDRPGHDLRYAIDPARIANDLGWQPKHPVFENGLNSTVDWYIQNEAWWRPLLSRAELPA